MRAYRPFRATSMALVLSAALPTLARADVFQLVSGTWGLIDQTELSCSVNPHRISFSADHSRAQFEWEAPMFSYEGQWRLEGGYSIIASDSTSLTMALDGESRRTEAGAPVIWILRVQSDGSHYCWARTDWEPDRCIDRYVRCAGPVPTS